MKKFTMKFTMLMFAMVITSTVYGGDLPYNSKNPYNPSVHSPKAQREAKQLYTPQTGQRVQTLPSRIPVQNKYGQKSGTLVPSHGGYNVLDKYGKQEGRIVPTQRGVIQYDKYGKRK